MKHRIAQEMSLGSMNIEHFMYPIASQDPNLCKNEIQKTLSRIRGKKPKRNRKETGTISVSVNERYSGFGSVSVFLKVTTFGYGSVSVSLKNGRKTGFSVTVRLTGRFLLHGLPPPILEQQGQFQSNPSITL